MAVEKPRYVLFETDVLIAAIDPDDPHHSEASDIITTTRNCSLSPYTLVELDLLIRSENVRIRNYQSFWRKLWDVIKHYNITIPAPSPLHHSKAHELRALYSLTYFDSLHAAAAMVENRTLVSYDERAYSKVEDLEYVHPTRLL